MKKNRLFSVLSNDMDESTLDEATGETSHLFDLEMHFSRNHREESIVAGACHPIAWVEFGATLTKDDIASFCPLIAENLDAETLGNRITTKVS